MSADRLSDGGSRLTRPFSGLTSTQQLPLSKEQADRRHPPSVLLHQKATDMNAALNNAKLHFLMSDYYWMIVCLPQSVWLLGKIGGGVTSKAAFYSPAIIVVDNLFVWRLQMSRRSLCRYSFS